MPDTLANMSVSRYDKTCVVYISTS